MTKWETKKILVSQEEDERKHDDVNMALKIPNSFLLLLLVASIQSSPYPSINNFILERRFGIIK